MNDWNQLMPSEATSEALRERIAQLADAHVADRVRRGSRLQRLALATMTGGAAIVLVGGVFINRPKRTNTHRAFVRASGQFSTGQVLAAKKIGDRIVRIYDVRVSARGDVFVLYTAGKRPDDALVIAKDGVARVMDSSIRTQDWWIELLDADGKVLHPQSTVHLPFRGNWGVDTAIVPERIAPNGEKFEAVCFARVPDVHDRLYTIVVRVSPTNEHTYTSPPMRLIRDNDDPPERIKRQVIFGENLPYTVNLDLQAQVLSDESRLRARLFARPPGNLATVAGQPMHIKKAWPAARFPVEAAALSTPVPNDWVKVGVDTAETARQLEAP